MSALEIDGVPYTVAGEPPAASSNGWGDMSWTRWANRIGVRFIVTK